MKNNFEQKYLLNDWDDGVGISFGGGELLAPAATVLPPLLVPGIGIGVFEAFA